MQGAWRTYASRPPTAWNSYTVIGKDNTAFGSMISFASASKLKGAISSALKLWIIIEDSLHILCV